MNRFVSTIMLMAVHMNAKAEDEEMNVIFDSDTFFDQMDHAKEVSVTAQELIDEIESRMHGKASELIDGFKVKVHDKAFGYLSAMKDGAKKRADDFGALIKDKTIGKAGRYVDEIKAEAAASLMEKINALSINPFAIAQKVDTAASDAENCQESVEANEESSSMTKKVRSWLGF